MKALLSTSELVRGSTSCATGAVYLWRQGEERFLVKTFWSNGWFSRRFFGRRGIANEWRILCALRNAGFSCAPSPYARIGDHTIVMEFIDGKKLESLHHYANRGETPPSPAVYRSLREELERLHEAGFVHGDFRRANVMVASQGERVRIIDWATGMEISDAEHFLYRQLHGSDNYSLVKILKDAAPELVSPEELQENAPGFFLRLGRFLRQRVYRGYIKPLFRRGRGRHSAE
ncbi:MAG: RIO1 family regulatory kinase/ATPase [Oligosphaeraceae bacterium]